MQFHAVLNKDGGALRTTDLDAFSKRLTETLEAAGHRVKIDIVAGKELEEALARAARSRCDVVLAGGGDGTTSAAAAALMNRKKALAVLPAGTMNLFARSLGIPLSLDAAIEAFATGKVSAVDVASANGRPFIHQFSIGLHARLVQLRSKMQFGSRFGKMRASARAAWSALMNPPKLAVTLKLGDAQVVTRTTSIGITNNLFGEGHLPYADHPDGGILGVYVTVAQERSEMLRFLFKMARGKWRDNEQVEIHETEEATLVINSSPARFRCAIDGELGKLEKKTVFRIHPGALQVLVPADSELGRKRG